MMTLVLLIIRRAVMTFLHDIHRDMHREKAQLQALKDNNYDLQKMKQNNPELVSGGRSVGLTGCTGWLYILIALFYFLQIMFKDGSQVAGAIVILLLCSTLLWGRANKRAAITMDILSLILMIQLGFIINGY